MYSKIYDFCKIRNLGNSFDNTNEPTPRVEYLMSLLDSEGIEYDLDIFGPDESYYNIVMRGNSTKMVVAHHDVANHTIDNANDNSASVINAIMVKKLMPEMNVVLLEGEEVGGIGSSRVSKQINNGEFGTIDWVLNLELTGKGGKYFFIGNYPGDLSDHITGLFDCPINNTPFNDSIIFRRYGIDSVVINPLPSLNEGKSSVKWNNDIYLDESIIFNCHNERDTIDSIDINDMKEFVEEVVIKILE